MPDEDPEMTLVRKKGYSVGIQACGEKLCPLHMEVRCMPVDMYICLFRYKPECGESVKRCLKA
jgi:hypothetical protein